MGLYYNTETKLLSFHQLVADNSTNIQAMSDYVRLTKERLSVEEATKLVSSNGAGAIATFTGTTRDTFKGKQVLYLEYEAYHDMAIKEMNKLCVKARTKYADVICISIMHRLGTVKIGEASVLIAVSSPHRLAALGKF